MNLAMRAAHSKSKPAALAWDVKGDRICQSRDFQGRKAWFAGITQLDLGANVSHYFRSLRESESL
jgi:hypothetical protein